MSPAVLLLAALCVSAADVEDSHRAPAPSTAEQHSVEADRQSTLAEMWQRGLLPPDTVRWSPEDFSLLERVRRAEAAGAVVVLRRRLHGLKGLAVEFRPVGALVPQWRLTKSGYDRYLFLRSQDAIEYFDSRDIGAKWAFQLLDLDGNRLFEKNGQLTEAGENLYNRVQAGMEAQWKSPAGELFGNRRRPPAPPAAAEPAKSAAAQPQAPARAPLRPRQGASKGQSSATIAPPAAQAKPVQGPPTDFMPPASNKAKSGSGEELP
ncbi:MAG: hypothetical protein HY077_03690 [Elusimicrobia bacterium]|nr:hypothetical protein [Elusimicrobiota bacterium]